MTLFEKHNRMDFYFQEDGVDILSLFFTLTKTLVII